MMFGQLNSLLTSDNEGAQHMPCESNAALPNLFHNIQEVLRP